MRYLLLILISLTLVPSMCAQNAKGDLYQNHQLAFELQKASDDQHFLRGTSLTNLNRDAVVGLVEPKNNFYSFVLVDHFGSLSVGDYAQIMLQELPIEGKKVHKNKAATYQGLPSIDLEFEGVSESRKVSYVVKMVSYENLIYQHVNFLVGPPLDSKATYPPVTFGEVLPKFEIMKGMVPRLESQTRENPRFGQVWYMDLEYFYHLGVGYKVPIQIPGYEVRYGEEAEYFHPSSNLAFETQSRDQGIYYLFLSGLADFSEVISLWKQGFESPQKLVEVEKKDQEARFEIKADKHHIVYRLYQHEWKGNRVLRVFYTLSSQGDLLPARLHKEAKILSNAERNKHTEVLSQRKHKRLLLGEDQSFFENTYRNYMFELMMQFDSTDLVEATINDQIGLDISYELNFENFSKDYHGTLQLQQDQFMDALEYHMHFFKGRAHLIDRKTNQQGPVYYTHFKVDGLPYEYVSITNKNGELYYRVTIWSRKPPEAKHLVSLVRYGRQEPYYVKDNHVVSHRMGYSFETSTKEKVINSTPEEVIPLGDVLEIKGTARDFTLYVLRSGLVEEELILDLFLQSRAWKTSLLPGPQTKESFLGMEVSKRRFQFQAAQGPQKLVQKSFRRGDTLFSLVEILKRDQQDAAFFQDHKLKVSRELSEIAPKK